MTHLSTRGWSTSYTQPDIAPIITQKDRQCKLIFASPAASCASTGNCWCLAKRLRSFTTTLLFPGVSDSSLGSSTFRCQGKNLKPVSVDHECHILSLLTWTEGSIFELEERIRLGFQHDATENSWRVILQLSYASTCGICNEVVLRDSSFLGPLA